MPAQVPQVAPVRGAVRLNYQEESDDEEKEDTWTWLDAGTVPVEKGSHMTDDLNVLREILLERGVVPRVYLKSLTRPRKLAWQGIVVHKVADREWQTIKRLLEHAGLKWRNDGWGGALFRVAEQPLRPKRRSETPRPHHARQRDTASAPLPRM